MKPTKTPHRAAGISRTTPSRRILHTYTEPPTPSGLVITVEIVETDDPARLLAGMDLLVERAYRETARPEKREREAA